MKIISIDLSVATGVAYFDTEQRDLLIDCFDYSKKRETPLFLNKIDKLPEDQLQKKSRRKRMVKRYDPSNHPYDFMEFTRDYIEGLVQEIQIRGWFINLNGAILEQTNKGQDRWKQKQLEWLHHELCEILIRYKDTQVKYIDTMEWRRLLGIKMSKEQRKMNKEIREHNKAAKEDKSLTRAMGITDTKTLSIDFANEKFNLRMQKKDNNIADAICVGYAWLLKEGLI